MPDQQITRHRYLIMQAILHGAGLILALESVASTALAHPEWDMDEEKTWDEWENQ